MIGIVLMYHFDMYDLGIVFARVKGGEKISKLCTFQISVLPKLKKVHIIFLVTIFCLIASPCFCQSMYYKWRSTCPLIMLLNVTSWCKVTTVSLFSNKTSALFKGPQPHLLRLSRFSIILFFLGEQSSSILSIFV